VVLIACGLLLHSAIRIPLGPREPLMALGALVLAVAVLLVGLAAKELRQAHTAFDVRKPTTRLVRSGVFAWSRNPVYLSMVLLCMAVGLLSNSLFLLLVSLPTASALCLLVIKREEAYLSSKFGSEYRDYRGHVRRWF
jgi:protein-S-isoprenylcysteine O-methyltransferase Ste14